LNRILIYAIIVQAANMYLNRGSAPVVNKIVKGVLMVVIVNNANQDTLKCIAIKQNKISV